MDSTLFVLTRLPTRTTGIHAIKAAIRSA